MAKTETQVDKLAKAASPNLVAPEFAAIGNYPLDEFFRAPTRQLERLREANENWLDRVRSEAALASELTIKLTAARSAPEVANAYLEWTIPHVERQPKMPSASWPTLKDWRSREHSSCRKPSGIMATVAHSAANKAMFTFLERNREVTDGNPFERCVAP